MGMKRTRLQVYKLLETLAKCECDHDGLIYQYIPAGLRDDKRLPGNGEAVLLTCMTCNNQFGLDKTTFDEINGIETGISNLWC